MDEVHMLTSEAFNALIKTLEEPPAHVLFVLATTEPHKVPLTILSRCQRFDFRPIPDEIIAGRLAEVAAKSDILVIFKSTSLFLPCQLQSVIVQYLPYHKWPRYLCPYALSWLRYLFRILAYPTSSGQMYAAAYVDADPLKYSKSDYQYIQTNDILIFTIIK